MIARPLFRASRLCCRCYATSTPTTPPMLLKIRKDMKTAMQNKDSNRLAVLRALLTSTLNASKTSNPITTDMQILALIRKNAAASRTASEEFKGAGRADLAEKEENQLKIMEEYTASVKLMGQDEIRSTVKMIVDTMRGDGVKLHMGDVLKTVFAPEVLGNAAVEKAEVTKIVKEVLAEA